MIERSESYYKFASQLKIAYEIAFNCGDLLYEIYNISNSLPDDFMSYENEILADNGVTLNDLRAVFSPMIMELVYSVVVKDSPTLEKGWYANKEKIINKMRLPKSKEEIKEESWLEYKVFNPEKELSEEIADKTKISYLKDVVTKIHQQLWELNAYLNNLENQQLSEGQIKAVMKAAACKMIEYNGGGLGGKYVLYCALDIAKIEAKNIKYINSLKTQKDKDKPVKFTSEPKPNFSSYIEFLEIVKEAYSALTANESELLEIYYLASLLPALNGNASYLNLNDLKYPLELREAFESVFSSYVCEWLTSGPYKSDTSDLKRMSNLGENSGYKQFLEVALKMVGDECNDSSHELITDAGILSSVELTVRQLIEQFGTDNKDKVTERKENSGMIDDAIESLRKLGLDETTIANIVVNSIDNSKDGSNLINTVSESEKQTVEEMRKQV